MRAAGGVLVALLAGCATTMQPVKVPVPVECQVAVPERPAMPTDALRPGATLDAFAQAAMAEIERREGYEVRLVAALGVCTKPLK